MFRATSLPTSQCPTYPPPQPHGCMAGRRLLHGLDDTVDEGDAAFDDAISAAHGLSNETGHAATCWVVAVVFVGLAVLLLVWRVYRWG